MNKFKQTMVEKIVGVFVIEPIVYSDQRGVFFESYNLLDYTRMNINCSFVQDNHSISIKNVIRGLHIQLNQPQQKLLRVVKGCIFDVAVDLRVDSPSYLNWFGIELSEDNKKQLFIPTGCAHGFLVLSDCAEVLYKVDNYWDKNDEVGILWNDPELNIQWPIDSLSDIILSEKDSHNMSLREFLSFLIARIK